MAIAALIHYSVTCLKLPFTRSGTCGKVSTPPFLSRELKEGTVAGEDVQKSYFTCTAVRSAGTASDVIWLCTVIGMAKCEQNTLSKEIRKDSGKMKCRHMVRKKT